MSIRPVVPARMSDGFALCARISCARRFGRVDGIWMMLDDPGGWHETSEPRLGTLLTRGTRAEARGRRGRTALDRRNPWLQPRGPDGEVLFPAVGNGGWFRLPVHVICPRPKCRLLQRIDGTP